MSRRRGYGEGSVSFDKSSGRWVGRLPRDAHGRRAKVTGKTAKEVQTKLRARLREREEGLPEPDARMTIEAFLERWVRDSLPLSNRAARTVASYAATVRLHLVPGLGRVKLAKLTPAHVQRFLREELEAGKGRRTVEVSHAVLRIALGQAEAWGLVRRNVAKLVKGPGGRAAEKEPFTIAEQAAILSAARNERLYPLFVTALATGMRLSELLGLRWRDVDLRAGTVLVTNQLSYGTRELAKLKSKASQRMIPLPARATAVLREHRKAQLQQPADPESLGSALVFRSTVGTPLSQRNVLRVWNRVLERAAVRHRGFHHLRHTYGTSLAERGVHERVAQELMGHADSRTTREIYTHTTKRMMDAAISAAADALDEVLEAASGSPIGSQDGQDKPVEGAAGEGESL
ncbi:MAG: tyrosine-type recombinase/integrase [Egibacteraceae bacterium]